MDSTTNFNSLEGIAIIGMAGRFPGAKNIEEFWQNLRSGVESISDFTDEEAVPAYPPINQLNIPRVCDSVTRAISKSYPSDVTDEQWKLL